MWLMIFWNASNSWKNGWWYCFSYFFWRSVLLAWSSSIFFCFVWPMHASMISMDESRHARLKTRDWCRWALESREGGASALRVPSFRWHKNWNNFWIFRIVHDVGIGLERHLDWCSILCVGVYIIHFCVISLENIC